MTEQTPTASADDAPSTEAPAEAAPAREPRATRRRIVGAGWLLALVILAGAVMADRFAGGSALPVPGASASSDLTAAFGALPAGAPVLIAMDPDLGTYPEIRPAARAALVELAQRGAVMVFVSVTVEGRAIASAELDRLRSTGVPADQLVDLGFVSGAEAALVRLTSETVIHGAAGPLPSAVAAIPGGLGAFDLALLVGGTDIGPRTWVEQVGTRLPGLPMVAIAPTFARPELEPYLRTGQLTALIATVGDAAAYVRDSDAAAATGDRPPGGAALLAGMLIALLVVGRRLLAALPRLGAGPLAIEEPDES